MVRKNATGGAKRSGDKKAKAEPLQKQGSLRKSAEVDVDVFGSNFLKPGKASATEEKSPESVDTASSKATAPPEDALEEKKSKEGVDRREEKGASADAAGTSDSKGEADNAKGGETAAKNEVARDKGGASADKHDEPVVLDRGKTAEKLSAPSDAWDTPKKREESDADSSLTRDKPAIKEDGVPELEPTRILKKSSPKDVGKKGDSIADDDSKRKPEDRPKTLLPPNKADAISAAISAAVDTAIPKEVKEAGENFEKAENAFMEARQRAENLVQKSEEDSKRDVDGKREVDREAVAATAEAVVAEAAAREALKGEVRAFLDMGETEKKSDTSEQRAGEEEEKTEKREESPEVKEPVSVRESPEKESGAAVGTPKKEERASPSRAQDADKRERATGEEAGAVIQVAGKKREESVTGAEETSKEKKDIREATVSPPPAQIKISPAHLLEYSKRRSSDRAAILAALAVVGLDTPETRRVVEEAENEAATLAEQEAIAAAAKVAAEEAGRQEGVVAKLNAFQKQTLAKLEGNQQYVILLEQRLQEELAALHDKYDRLMEPVFDERARILFTGGDEDDQTGATKKETTKTERENGRKNEEESATQYRLTPSSESRADLRAAAMKNEVGTRALPGFWLQAFSNHKLLSSLIGQRDKPLLLYLQNVRRVFHMEKAEGFSLVFEFGENPFFTPQTLTKAFRMREEEAGADWVVSKTEGTPIQWEEGMDVTVRIILRKQLNMRTKSERMVKEIITEKSFFHFFKNSVVPTDEEIDAMPEEEQSSLFTLLKTEYDVGVVIRDLIIPHAVDWYLGTATDELEKSSEESDTETEVPSQKTKRRSVATAQPSEPSADDTANSFASWFGF